MNSIRIKIDEDLPPSVAGPFEEAGADCRTVFEQNWGGTPDVDLWPMVQDEGRILLTGDVRLADVRIRPPGSHAGLVLFRLERESREGYVNLARKLTGAGELSDLTVLVGAVTVVTEDAIRIRRAH